jgi:AraC-like DNA-binding protein
MITGVNPLTDRASRRRAPAGPPPIPAIHIRRFGEGLSQLGYDAPRLFEAIGCDPRSLEDPDALVPCTWSGALIEAARRQRPMRNLSLRLASTSAGGYPLLEYVVFTSRTLGEAQRRLVHYFGIMQLPIAYEIREDEDPIRTIVRSPGNPFGVEFTIAINVIHARRETAGSPALAVSFAHEPEEAAEFEKTLGCPVRTRQDWDGVEIARASWNLPLRRRDSVLQGLLERQADEMLGRLRRPDTESAALEAVLARRVAGGDTAIASVARELGTSSRTLQRRLAAEGTSYQAVLDRVRRGAAEGYLADSTLSVGEVAYLLGYSEPAAFHRAFRRWRGLTPLEYRKRSRG